MYGAAGPKIKKTLISVINIASNIKGSQLYSRLPFIFYAFYTMAIAL